MCLLVFLPRVFRSLLSKALTLCLIFGAWVGNPQAGSAAEAAQSGDAVIRAPFGNSEIVITTTSRLAGAIHSVTWKEREFIDSEDHGRQLQSAASFDNTPEAVPETFNPTEAGCRLDGAGPHSTSRVLAVSTAGNVLRTRTQMAFWLSPGERSAGQLARNTFPVSAHLLEKEVRLGAFGLANVLDYTVTFHTPPDEPHRTAQFEALTGYMPPEFSVFHRFVRATGKLELLSDGPGEQSEPVVLATPDGQFAMGVISIEAPPAGASRPSYGRFRFTQEKVVKWNCVFRMHDDVKPGAYRFRMFVALGTLADVEKALSFLTTRP